MATLCGRPDQPEGPLVGDVVVRDVDTMHGESLWLRVEVFHQGLHEGILTSRKAELRAESEKQLQPAHSASDKRGKREKTEAHPPNSCRPSRPRKALDDLVTPVTSHT